MFVEQYKLHIITLLWNGRYTFNNLFVKIGIMPWKEWQWTIQVIIKIYYSFFWANNTHISSIFQILFSHITEMFHSTIDLHFLLYFRVTVTMSVSTPSIPYRDSALTASMMPIPHLLLNASFHWVAFTHKYYTGYPWRNGKNFITHSTGEH